MSTPPNVTTDDDRLLHSINDMLTDIVDDTESVLQTLQEVHIMAHAALEQSGAVFASREQVSAHLSWSCELDL